MLIDVKIKHNACATRNARPGFLEHQPGWTPQHPPMMAKDRIKLGSMVVAAVLYAEACSTAAWSPNASAARPGRPPSAGSTAPRWRTPVSSRGIARQPCMAANCGYNI